MAEPGRIVVGVDGSPASRAALKWAIDEARQRSADLDVVLAWRHPDAGFTPMYNVPLDEDLEADARKTCERILSDEGLGRKGDIRATPIVVQGPAAPSLISAAQGADLLVVGSRGRGALTGMFLGSVSLHCVTHGPCPVAVIRLQDAEERS